MGLLKQAATCPDCHKTSGEYFDHKVCPNCEAFAAAKEAAFADGIIGH